MKTLLENIKIIIVIIITIIIIVISFFFGPWISLYFGLLLEPNPPKPEIKYAEFPFKLEYEINGETVIVEDTLICKFDGFGMDEGRGKYRKWKSYWESKNRRITLLRNEEIEIFFTVGFSSSRIAGVYMGDLEDYPGDGSTVFPDALYTTEFKDEKINAYVISADELWKKYKIKLMDWKYTSPIENTFK